ncbi:MAG: glycogen synthase GlgA [Parachlamydiaceae bacterium]|nr:glycogen synthase GlgA [Parachlamydiaceae bacterium]
MHIIHIASELAPIAKVGGLADVTLGLCRELSWKGHDVDIVLPFYDCMDSSQIRDLSILTTKLMSYYQGEEVLNTIWMGWVENLRVYFIEPHHSRYFFNRGCFYGCEDDIERYLYFSRAALEFLYKFEMAPDIIHLHEWQTAVIAPLYYTMYQKIGFNKSKIVFTIHNIEYQGNCAVENLDFIGMDGEKELTPEKLQDPLYKDSINLLKGALVYSDYITTVSPSYANEVLTKEGGRGLEHFLNKYKNKFSGILNGIDYSYWNPEIDRYLPTHFSSRELPLNKKDYNTLNKKAFIKHLVREKFELDEVHRPIVGCIARLVPQKGIDLIEHAIKYAVTHNGQFLLLGSSPIPAIQERFHDLQQHYDNNPHVHLTLHHQEDLAHLIYAASDMFVVPSLFEPCGLTQMIALKYGAIPIVRKTGGLADTIFDIDSAPELPIVGNGYTFIAPTSAAIESALSRAFDCWFHNPEKWRSLLIHGMSIDFSWNQPSDRYLEIYTKLCGNSKES